MSDLQKLTRRQMWQLLGAGAVGATLAACGATSPTPTAAPTSVPTRAAGITPAAATPAVSTPASTAVVAANTPATGTRTIELKRHTSPSPAGPAEEFQKRQIAKFEQEHPGVKVVDDIIPAAEIYQKLVVLASTGQIGDVFSVLAPQVSEFQVKKLIRDMDGFLRTDTQWREKEHPQVWPGLLQTLTRDGKLWGMPYPGHPGAVQHFFNKTMLEQAGAKLPPTDGKWTLDDLVTILKTVTKDTNGDGRTDQYGYWNGLQAYEQLPGVLRAFGGDIYDADGRKCLLGTPESKAGLVWLADLFHTHKVAIDPKTDVYDVFPNQKLGIAVLTSVVQRVGNAVGTKFEWAVAPPPLGPSGKYASQVSSGGTMIPLVSKNPEAAWEYLKHQTSKWYGVEAPLAGVGSPGGRFDVWNDPKLFEALPKLKPIADVMVNPPAPPVGAWHHPANGRFLEATTTIDNIMQDVWLGSKKPEQAADEAARTIQAIMDKPPA